MARSTVRWDLSLQDIVWSVFIDADYDGNVTWQEVQNAKPAIGRRMLAQISVQRGGAPCALAVQRLRAGQPRASRISFRWQCRPNARSADSAVVGGPLFMSGDASQRVLLSAVRGKVQFTGVLSAAEPSWTEPEQASAWSSFVRFIGEGIWHVLIGYDHIAFVLLLLLPSVMRPVDGKWHGATGFGQVTRDVVTIITAFTIAHSITLALAVTGTVKLPDTAHRGRDRRVDRGGGCGQSGAAPVEAAPASGIRLRIRARLRVRECAQ